MGNIDTQIINWYVHRNNFPDKALEIYKILPNCALRGVFLNISNSESGHNTQYDPNNDTHAWDYNPSLTDKLYSLMETFHRFRRNINYNESDIASAARDYLVGYIRTIFNGLDNIIEDKDISEAPALVKFIQLKETKRALDMARDYHSRSTQEKRADHWRMGDVLKEIASSYDDTAVSYIGEISEGLPSLSSDASVKEKADALLSEHQKLYIGTKLRINNIIRKASGYVRKAQEYIAIGAVRMAEAHAFYQYKLD